MKKFGFLIGNFLKKRILSKGFIITNVIFLVLAFLIAYIPGVIKGGSRIKPDYEENFKSEIVFSYDAEYENDKLEKYFFNVFNKSYFPNLKRDSSNLKIKKNLNLDNNHEKIKEYFKKQNISLGIYLVKNSENKISSYLYLGTESEKVKNAAAKFINTFDSEISGFNSNKKIDVISDINFNSIIKRQRITATFSTILVGLVITLIIQSVQTSSVDVVLEKSNRVIEQIILNVSEEKHLLSKVLGGVLVSIIQILLIVSFLFLAGFIVNKGIIDIIPYVVSDTELFLPILFGVLFSIAGTFLFIMIFVYLAAISNGQEEFTTISGPVLGLVIVLFYIPIGLFYFKNIRVVHNILMVFNYLPPFSIIVSPVLLISKEIMWYDAFVSLLIIATISANTFYVLIPSYKAAILNYNSNLKLFKRIGFYIKEAKRRKKELKENKKWHIQIF